MSPIVSPTRFDLLELWILKSNLIQQNTSLFSFTIDYIYNYIDLKFLSSLFIVC